MGDLPTLRQELNRKAAETMNWLAHGLDNSRITEAQFSVAVDAVNMAVCGLADAWFVEIVTESERLMQGHKSVVTDVYLRGGEVRRIRWAVGSDELSIGYWSNGIRTQETTVPYTDAKAAREWMRKVGAALVDKGWTKL